MLFFYLRVTWLWGLGGRAESLCGFPFPTAHPLPPRPLFNSKTALIKNVPVFTG